MTNTYFDTRDQNGQMVSSASGNSVAGGSNQDKESNNLIQLPSISLPRGGGAIKSIDEKFSVNAVNGTSSFSIALPVGNAREFNPALRLTYNSGAGNGIFGMGWSLDIPSIKRKTEKGLPRYYDQTDSDTYVFSEAEDLVPEFAKDENGNWRTDALGNFIVNEFNTDDGLYIVKRYKPRIEGTFARIERWTEKLSGLIYWRTISSSNITSIFGKSDTSRIADPNNKSNIFKWLLDCMFDDKGNCAVYDYKKEDAAGIDALQLHNRNRINGNAPFTNIYLKRVRHGNIIPCKDGILPVSFMFETVFDYGEHDAVNIPFNEITDWDFRSDAFSDYRAGFEIRTCRLCKRVLLYHYFDELPGGSALTRAAVFMYDDNNSKGFTFLKAITETGFTKYDDSSYSQKSFPPFSFGYQQHDWNTQIKSIDPENLLQAPAGLDEPVYEFIDLFSEGLSGILTEQADEWWYKSNLGNGNFTPAQLVVPRPSFRGLQKGWQVMDLESNGLKQLVSWKNKPEGFFELTSEDEWIPFQPFSELPTVDFTDADTRFLDLDGDGRADILISQDNVFSWYASEGKAGFSFAGKVCRVFDEEKGPAIVFRDAVQSIFLADMSGDGLTDIVRIKNGEVCYWPNIGYGKFGAKISMDNAPLFDRPDQFNPSLLRLADLDGSGTADLVYLGKNIFNGWLNQQGNSFAELPVSIDPFPQISNHEQISVIDLLGNGMACIVWNSNLPGNAARPLQFIDLFNSRKPHLMVSYKNNLGKEVFLEYTPSTKFYIDDKLAGTPWVTKLHFPVHCISKVTTCDRIMKTRFASEYTYHHGYYDYSEREFRGFGRVDQRDAEDIEHFIKQGDDASNNITEADLHQPPVLTKTWFHTGAFVNPGKVLDQYKHEYFQNNAYAENILPGPVLPQGIDAEERREALRACKGTLLRKEIYALDGTPESNIPYAVEHHNCLVKILQPLVSNRYAIFLVHETEGLTYHYERNPADPRIAHNFILDTDQYGNILKSAELVYPRKSPVPGDPAIEPEQAALHIILYENNYTNDILQNDAYRTPAIATAKTYEVTGLVNAADYFSLEEIKNGCNAAVEIDYEVKPTAGIQKRVTAFVQTQYRADDTVTALPFGIIDSKALVHESFKAGFNQNILQDVFASKISYNELQNVLTDPLQGGFLFRDGYFWMASGRQQYDQDHFYLTTRFTDPFGNITSIAFDGKYDLYIRTITDALNNKIEVNAFNFRTLMPYLVQDINNNQSATRFDELGMVVKTFIIGKKGTDQGDLFDDTKTEMKDALDQPTTEYAYNIFDWYNQSTDPGFGISQYKPKPAYAQTRVRETHYFADPQHQTRWQESYSYSDGSGHEVLKKGQAEPGQALSVQDDGTVSVIDTSPAPRWVGNGRLILNNKGNPVKQYQPYFSVSPSFDDEKEMVEMGVTPVIHYDPLGRAIRTDLPDKTFTTTTFTPWQQINYDANDTVMDSGWYADRGSPDPNGPEPSDPDIRSAWLAAKNYNTPRITYFDSPGRMFLVIEDSGSEKIALRTKLDIEGNQLQLTDAYNRTVMQYVYGMAANALKQTSMDAGSRWTIHDVAGKPLLSWDDRLHEFAVSYDALRRITGVSVKTGVDAPVMYGRMEYGESLTVETAQVSNLLGRVSRHYQPSGIYTNKQFDFKGNLLSNNIQLVSDYKNQVDWTQIAAVKTDEAIFEGSSEYDALNRPVKMVTPHAAGMKATEFYPSYNEAGVLEKMEVIMQESESRTVFVSNINYNEKGQRTEIFYGNNTKTAYTYEKETFRLKRLLTTRNTGNDILQDLNYLFDAVGNVTWVTDNAQADVFFDGEQVKAVNRYEYDALYRLISATGRKQAGQTDINNGTTADFNNRNFPFINSNSINPNDAQAFRNYTEIYTYDLAGNMVQQQHVAKNSSWTRNLTYTNGNNQLTHTDVGAFNFNYLYDAHGNLGLMEHLKQMDWNYKDQLSGIDLGGGGHAYYVYDEAGERVRKVTERQDGTRQERLYLGVIEVYREYNNANEIVTERESLYVMDDKKTIALVETASDQENTGIQTTNPGLFIRYQYSNLPGSVSLELDDAAQIISYEEYFPYGSTSCSTMNTTREVPAKRYRYTARERDEESGLNYHGTRYYALWLCRWVSPDATGVKDGLNVYSYVHNNPVMETDDTGTQGISVFESAEWKEQVNEAKQIPLTDRNYDFDKKEAELDTKSHFGNIGIAKKENALEYIEQSDKLAKDWAGLTKEQRRAGLEQLLNAQLLKENFPAITIVYDREGGPNSFGGNANEWAVHLSQGGQDFLALNEFSSFSFSQVIATLYHEARHSEQKFRAIQYLIATNKDIPAFAAPQSVIDLARKQVNDHPLKAGSDEYAFAEISHRFTFGDKAGFDETVETNIALSVRNLRHFLDKHKDPGKPGVAAMLAALRKEVKTWAEKYYKLPGESDSFMTMYKIYSLWNSRNRPTPFSGKGLRLAPGVKTY